MTRLWMDTNYNVDILCATGIASYSDEEKKTHIVQADTFQRKTLSCQPQETSRVAF
jgi:hypothetical protein